MKELGLTIDDVVDAVVNESSINNMENVEDEQ